MSAIGVVLILVGIASAISAAWIAGTFAPVSAGGPWWSSPREISFPVGTIFETNPVVTFDLQQASVHVPLVEQLGWTGLRVSTALPEPSFLGLGAAQVVDDYMVGVGHGFARRATTDQGQATWQVDVVPGVRPVPDLVSMDWLASEAAVNPIVPLPSMGAMPDSVTVVTETPQGAGDRHVELVFIWPDGGRTLAWTSAAAVGCALAGASLLAIGWGRRRQGAHREATL